MKIKTLKTVTHFFYFFRHLLIVFPVMLLGCATQSADQYLSSFDSIKYKSTGIETCADRTGLSGTRDIGAEASLSLQEKITESGLFRIDPDGDLMITCDLERFDEGSAIKRWLWPGWGTTKAKVTVMVWERQNQKVLTVLSSVATVQAGGLYTIGADHYIIDVAMRDIVSKLKRWVQGHQN